MAIIKSEVTGDYSWVTSEQLHTILNLAEGPRTEMLILRNSKNSQRHLAFECFSRGKARNHSSGRISPLGEVIHDA